MANGRLRQPRPHVACDVSEEPDALEGRSTVCSFSAGRASLCRARLAGPCRDIAGSSWLFGVSKFGV